MSKIIVIAPQFVGDSILAIPFLRELKKHCGRTEIDVLTKNAGCLIFSKCRYVSEVFDINHIDYKKLRSNKYEKAYVLKRSFSAALIAFLIGAKKRIGFGGQFREIFLTKVVNYNKEEKKHELQHFMDVLKADYIEITDESLELFVDSESVKSIQNYLTERKKVLVVACSSTHVKDWEADRFAAVSDFLIQKGYTVYFAGLEREKAYCDNIVDLMKEKDVKNLCGVLSFDEITALISKMDLIFGVDSGFCHAGAALGKKVAVMFGSTSLYQWAPLGDSCVITAGVECAPCKKPKKCRSNFICMKNISSEMVISKLEKFL